MREPCRLISNLLEKFFDQEASDQEKAKVESHLRDCPMCRQSLERMEALRTLIRAPIDQASRNEAYPWVWQKIEKGIKAKARGSVWDSLVPWLDLSFLRRRRVWAPAVAAALLLFILLVPWFYKETPSHPEGFVVEYVESKTNNVMVYELEQVKVTVIWLFEATENGPSPS